MGIFFYVIDKALYLLSIAIVIRMILSWVASPQSRIRIFFHGATEPFVSPFYKISAYIIRKWRIGVDFSAFFAIIAIQILSSIVQSIWLYLIP